eukprot:270-Eustigmatos_ZCMA.PRE.1
MDMHVARPHLRVCVSRVDGRLRVVGADEKQLRLVLEALLRLNTDWLLVAGHALVRVPASSDQQPFVAEVVDLL